MLRLILVRHGETECNVKDIGKDADDPLTILGINQAKKLALRLKDEKIDAVYVSDYPRAVETAKEILKFHFELKPVYSPLLRERSLGDAVGLPLSVIRKERQESGVPYAKHRTKNGESFLDAQKRALDLIEELKKKHSNQTVLLVGHGVWMSTLIAFFFELEPTLEEFHKIHPKNTAVSVLEIEEGKKPHFSVLN